jgi:tRNA threonylcarbamoyladenosine biosynthesis protein TsaB
MTISLAIDTATSRTIVAVIEDQIVGESQRVLFEGFHEGATDHGRALSELVKKALAKCSQIDLVVVGMGPGPFTGLRVGISFAQSFALARGISLRGVCSLDAIDIHHGDYTVGVDARRHEIYWARYQNGARVEGPSVSKPSEVPGCITDLFPDMSKLVMLAKKQNIKEPMYLRRPDAIPTVDRR